MDKKLTTEFGAPVDDNQNIATIGERVRRCSRTSGFLRRWRTSTARLAERIAAKLTA